MIDTEALRKKVIDLAIQGKLTEQLSSDGDAETLYAKIQEEKARLVKEGKIKKDKQLPEITDEEIPFEIPESWKWVYMGDIFDHNTGKALNNADKEGTKLEYITTSNMYWDHFELDGLKNMFFKESEIEKCTIRKGDLLICEGGDIGRSAIWNFDYEMRIQNHIHRLRSYGEIDHRFYFYLMRNYKDNGMIDGRGIGLQGFSSKRVHSLVVPLAPLAEQKRIVDKLEDVLAQIDIIDELQSKYNNDLSVLKNKIIDAGIRGKLTEQLPEDGTAEELYQKIQEEKAELIKNGIIKKEKALPEITKEEIPFEIPDNWKWVRLGELIHISSGNGLTASEMKEGSIPVYGGNGITGYHNEATVFKKTIVIGRVGFYCGSVHITPEKAWVTDNAFITIYPEKNLDQSFLAIALKQMNLGKNINGAAQPVVSGKKIYPLLFPLPPLAEQKRIAENIEDLLQYCL